MANPFKAHPRVKNTDGRTPTTTHQGGAPEKEGNATMHMSGGKRQTATNDPEEGSDDLIDRMTTRGAKGFRNDIVKRNAKIKGGRKRACD
jgi:hypothetical protein